MDNISSFSRCRTFKDVITQEISCLKMHAKSKSMLTYVNVVAVLSERCQHVHAGMRIGYSQRNKMTRSDSPL